MTVFVDTNVLVDVLAHREPFYDDAAAVWSLVEGSSIAGFASAVSVTNIYYLVAKLKSRKDALDSVRKLRHLFCLVACEEATIDRALQLEMKDFEDAVQLASAEAIRAACVISRNPSDFPRDSIRILTPSAFLAEPEIVKLTQ